MFVIQLGQFGTIKIIYILNNVCKHWAQELISEL